MKTTTKTFYKCETCGTEYQTEASAKQCESRPIMQDKGVKVGDTVIVTQGGGTGCKAIVESLTIYNKEWGHYAWDRYWHTVGLTAKLVGSIGHRQLTFDSYKLPDNAPDAASSLLSKEK